MLTLYCSGCRETFRSGHRNAEEKASEHLRAHDLRDEEAMVTALAWIQKNWDEDEFWETWYLD